MGLFSKTPKWEKARQKATKAHSQGNFSTAFYLFQEALEACPDEKRAEIVAEREVSASVLFQLNWEAAESLLDANDLKAAEERLGLALAFVTDEQQRQRIEARLREIGQSLASQEELAEVDEELGGAVEDLDELDLFNGFTAQMSEERADLYYELGDDFRRAFVAVHTGRAEQALTYFDKAATKGQDPIILYEFGACLRELGRVEEAIEIWLKAERLEPDWLGIKLDIAVACWGAGRLELAEEVLQRAIDQDDESIDVYRAVCATALLTGSPEYGLEAAEVALGLAGNHDDVLLLRGQLLELAGRAEEAVHDYETVLKRTWRYDTQHNALVFDILAGLLAARHYWRTSSKLERAEELLRSLKAVTPAPMRWQFDLALADVLLAAGHEEEARETCRALKSKIPEDQPLALMRLAELEADQERLQELAKSLDEKQEQEWQAFKSNQETWPGFLPWAARLQIRMGLGAAVN